VAKRLGIIDKDKNLDDIDESDVPNLITGMSTLTDDDLDNIEGGGEETSSEETSSEGTSSDESSSEETSSEENNVDLSFQNENNLFRGEKNDNNMLGFTQDNFKISLKKEKKLDNNPFTQKKESANILANLNMKINNIATDKNNNVSDVNIDKKIVTVMNNRNDKQFKRVNRKRNNVTIIVPNSNSQSNVVGGQSNNSSFIANQTNTLKEFQDIALKT